MKNSKGQEVWCEGPRTIFHECRKSKKSYNKARKKFNKYPSYENKAVLKYTSKKYKQSINKYINKFNKENEKKLRSLNSKQPKDYWKLLNSLKDKSKVETPNLDALFTHWKMLTPLTTMKLTLLKYSKALI